MARDDLPKARKLLEQSFNDRLAEQEKITAAESRLDLARLALEEGHPAIEAEMTAREVGERVSRCEGV